LGYRTRLAWPLEGRSQGKTINLEGRYALADWNKIPLHPTIFAE
jgi:hypothetical protein